MKIPLLLIIVFLLSSCSDKKKINGIILNDERKFYENNFTLSQNNIKEFSLDSVTINLINYIQYIDIDSINCLSILNEYNNSIYFFDYESSDFSHQIQCKKSNDVAGNIRGFYYLNKDSIFVYSYASGFLYCMNSEADVFIKHRLAKIVNSNKMIYPYSYATTFAPLKEYDSKIITIGLVTGESSLETGENRPVVSIFDLENKLNSYVINYPEPYVTYNWGGGLTYRLAYYDLCPESIIVSFPASHNLLKYSLLTGEQTNYYAGSLAIEYMKSFPYSKDTPIDEEKAWEWYMNNPSYEGVLYDKYLDRYYRIARLPVTEFNKDEIGNSKPVVIVILDKNLQYIGEVSLPTDIRFFPTNCFVSRDGFNIQVLTDNEDKLTFYQYKFINNEEG